MPILILFLLALITGPGQAQDRAANHLAGAQSPYLLQHQFNPVEWYPWGQEALDRARRENKPIFVSVGYSSCHWCHVMADESFENDAIAGVLNANFISIKIDRERRPDLDEQFMLATQLLAGAGGWPNSVFLTPTGEPFFGGTYFPPVQFHDLLNQVSELWETAPDSITSEGERVATILREFMTRKAQAQDLSAPAVYQAAREILGQTDPFSGGIGDTAKFPQETLFLFLLDQANRTGDAQMLAGVTEMLDAMIRGGIHDHVGGGFHRYAVDPDWRVPHFEKMLYNQAMTGRLLVRAWQATGRQSYRRAATRLFTYVLRDLRDPSGGFYAAEDADSDDGTGEHVEGVFYTWSLENLGEDADLLATYFDISENGDLEGANVLNLIDNPRVLAAESDISQPDLFANLDPVLEQLLQRRNARIRPGIDSKVLMGWNGAMIATLAEAGHVFDEPAYLLAAQQAADHILSRMQTDTGFLRVWFDGKPGTPAQLADYASLGLGLVALHDYARDPFARARWLKEANSLTDQILARFGSPQDGFRMNETTQGFSTVIPVDDGELQSGNAMALDLFARLAKRMARPELQLVATRLAGALSGLALEIPEQRAGILTASQDLQFGETASVRYVANGAVRLDIGFDRQAGTVEFVIEIAEGWHLNAHEPLEDYFIPVELVVGDTPLANADYPDPIIRSLGFNPQPLALYEGAITLGAPTDGTGSAVLTLQACSDEICLQPEEIRFQMW